MMLLTFLIFLLIIAIIALIFALTDVECPYSTHILGYTLSVAIFLFLGYTCLFGRVVFNPQLFYQSIGMIGMLLICLGAVVFIFALFEYANTIKMRQDLGEQKRP